MKIPKLKDNPEIFNLVKKIEENIYKMNDEDFCYVLKKIIESQKIGIFLNSLFFKIVDFLIEDDNFKLLSKKVKIEIFVILVKSHFFHICDKNDENVKFLIKEILREISKFVNSDLLEKEIYFGLIKYYFLYDFVNYKKIMNLNKRIFENKKFLNSENFFFWFFLNTKIEKNNKFIFLILKEILNKKIFKNFDLIKSINFLNKIQNLNFENQKLLKIAIIENFHLHINEILKSEISKNKKIFFLKELLIYIKKNKIQNIPEILQNLKIILKENLYQNSENFFIYLIFFENEIEIKNEEIEKLLKNGIFQGFDPKIYFLLYNFLLNYEMDFSIYKKKGFKILIKKFYKFENDEEYINFLKLLNSFIKEDKNFFIYYLDNFKKFLNKIEIFNFSEKKKK